LKIRIQTTVNQSFQQVWTGFDESLFNRLAPPFPPVKVVRFDGCLTGQVVDLELNFIVFKQNWTSHIIDQQESETEIYFIDKGTKLPFFLSFWEHKHRIIKNGEGTIIADEITFQTPFLLTNYLMYPLLWTQFLYRKPIYKKAFDK
jgi:ligand-binding SRPBCC domain-containing protein